MTDLGDRWAGQPRMNLVTKEDLEHFEKFVANSIKCSDEAYSHLMDAQKHIDQAHVALKHLLAHKPLSDRMETLRHNVDSACRHVGIVNMQFRVGDFGA